MLKRSNPVHHPEEEFLAAYAAGTVTGARALIAAAHLTYCPECRAKVAAYEALAGELLEREPGVGTGLIPNSDAEPLPAGQILPDLCDDFSYAPRPLRLLLQKRSVGWVNVWFGVKELPIQGFAPAARLLWIPPGRRMPRHDHHGEELTLVLRGSFSDATGDYAAGDLQTGAIGLEHQPQAGADGPCMCLVVEEGGLKLSGWLGRMVAWRGGRRDGQAA